MADEQDLAGFAERMEKRLRERARGSGGGRHLAAFNALRPTIEDALRRGYSVRATWAALLEEKRVSMSYQAFRQHCRRAGIGRDTQSAKSARPPTAPIEAPRPVGTVRAEASPGVGNEPKGRGFRHDRVPRKDDIYGE